jgi:hypothetical protein
VGDANIILIRRRRFISDILLFLQLRQTGASEMGGIFYKRVHIDATSASTTRRAGMTFQLCLSVCILDVLCCFKPGDGSIEERYSLLFVKRSMLRSWMIDGLTDTGRTCLRVYYWIDLCGETGSRIISRCYFFTFRSFAWGFRCSASAVSPWSLGDLASQVGSVLSLSLSWYCTSYTQPQSPS